MELHLQGIALPFRIRPVQPISDDELMQFCASNGNLPVEREADGELLIMTPVNPTTSNKELRIARYLDVWADEVGSGLAFNSNAGFTLPDGSMRMPDAAWISDRRWRSLSADEQQKLSHVCPEFVIELRSPTDNLARLESKMAAWIQNGAELAWLIDPVECAVTIYRPDREPERLDAISQVAGEGPVAGFVLPLDRIFS